MSSVLFVSGTTRGDALGGIGRALGALFNRCGYEFIEVNLAQPNAIDLLNKVINEKQKRIEFVLSFLGMGAGLKTNEAPSRNVWEALGVPFISLYGDAPFYFFDRHVHESQIVGSLYGFPEHYALRKRLPKCNGLIGLIQPTSLDMLAKEDIDFKRKEQGKLFFLKNGNDPQKLVNIWKTSLSPEIASMLCELAGELESEITSSLSNNIDEFITAYFQAKGLDIEALVKLRLFFNAQLDDYLRRIKSTMMAEVLMDFPVEIHGHNWDHLDFSGKRCTFVNDVDYRKSQDYIRNSLGIIDMSPNTGMAPHDRPCRAFGMYTLCLTNEQPYFQEGFANYQDFSFKFDKESMRDKISDVLSRPKQYVELGIEVAETFRAANPPENFVRSMLETASAIRLACSSRPPNMQNFFDWPPSTL